MIKLILIDMMIVKDMSLVLYCVDLIKLLMLMGLHRNNFVIEMGFGSLRIGSGFGGFGGLRLIGCIRVEGIAIRCMLQDQLL